MLKIYATSTLVREVEHQVIGQAYSIHHLMNKFQFKFDSNMAAFTNGPSGPGPRGPLIFLNLGGPEQDFNTYEVLLNAILCLNQRLQTTQ